jgi:hypothetical protein
VAAYKSQHECAEIISRLLAFGADPTIRNELGFDARDLGLTDALAEYEHQLERRRLRQLERQLERERERERQEKAAEQREWHRKLMHEADDDLTHEESFYEQWFAEEDDDTGLDWMEEVASSMRSKLRQRFAETTAPSSSSSSGQRRRQSSASSADPRDDEYFAWNRSGQQQSSSGSGGGLKVQVDPAVWALRREADNSAWLEFAEQFRGSPDASITHSDVPWPSGPVDNVLWLDDSVDDAARKVTFFLTN